MVYVTELYLQVLQAELLLIVIHGVEAQPQLVPIKRMYVQVRIQ